MQVIEILFPVLVLVLTGYVVSNRGYFSTNDCRSLSKFVFTYLIPALLFIGTASAELPEILEWQFLLSFYCAVILVYLISLIIGKYAFGYQAAEQGVFAIGASYSNLVIIGLPMCMQALGEESILPLFIIVSIHNLVLFTMGILTAEQGTRSASSIYSDLRNLLKQLITSPITGSLIAGVAVNLLSIPIYAPLKNSISLLSTAAIPCALFVLGASLNQYHINTKLIRSAVVMTVFKTILMPIFVWLFAYKIFSINKLWADTAILASSMPVGINAYVFAKKYDVGEELAATGIVTSTLACILTVSGILVYLENSI